MEFTFRWKLHAPGIYAVDVLTRAEDGEWALAGMLTLTTEEWQALRAAIMLGGGGVLTLFMEAPESWQPTL